jgi:hypothetical protein
MFIKDIDCTKDTPVVLDRPDTPIYGKGIRIKPGVRSLTILKRTYGKS